MSEYGKRTVFVTLNQVLRRQAQRKADLIKLKYLAIITYADLPQYIDADAFYVLDEYYAQLFLTDVEYCEQTLITPFFLMGHQYSAVLSTGHFSSGLDLFLR